MKSDVLTLFQRPAFEKTTMIKITNTTRLIFSLLALLTASVLLPADANGQSRVELYLRNADLDGDGRIEPNEMTGPIRSYLRSRGYEVTQRHRIRDIVKSESEKKSATPTPPADSKLKVPKFGVEVADGAGVSSFGITVEKVEYPESVNKTTRELFQRYDRNGDNFLDENEMRRGNWGSPDPSTNDTNGDGRLSFSEVQARYHDRETAQKRSEQAARDRSERGGGDEGERGNRGERGGDRTTLWRIRPRRFRQIFSRKQFFK